jgi:hypothetical protein
MLYASSKDRFKWELDGIQVELQATDPREMSMDIIHATQRVLLRRLRLQLRHRRELPEEQDLLRLLVCNEPTMIICTCSSTGR